MKQPIKKIELKHLVGYLPYKLRAANVHVAHVGLTSPLISEVDCYNVMNFVDNTTDSKIILRSLFTMTEEELLELVAIEKRGLLDENEPITNIRSDKNFIQYTVGKNTFQLCLDANKGGLYDINTHNITHKCMIHTNNLFEIYEWFFSKHFDVHGLIFYNLAIDINELKLK
jgi:hypothetical protein